MGEIHVVGLFYWVDMDFGVYNGVSADGDSWGCSALVLQAQIQG